MHTAESTDSMKVVFDSNRDPGGQEFEDVDGDTPLEFRWELISPCSAGGERDSADAEFRGVGAKDGGRVSVGDVVDVDALVGFLQKRQPLVEVVDLMLGETDGAAVGLDGQVECRAWSIQEVSGQGNDVSDVVESTNE